MAFTYKLIFLIIVLKEPQPVKPWIGVWNATIPGSPCFGPDYSKLNFTIIGQEDCLYLNVYTPKVISCVLISILYYTNIT